MPCLEHRERSRDDTDSEGRQGGDDIKRQGFVHESDVVRDLATPSKLPPITNTHPDCICHPQAYEICAKMVNECNSAGCNVWDLCTESCQHQSAAASGIGHLSSAAAPERANLPSHDGIAEEDLHVQ